MTVSDNITSVNSSIANNFTLFSNTSVEIRDSTSETTSLVNVSIGPKNVSSSILSTQNTSELLTVTPKPKIPVTMTRPVAQSTPSTTLSPKMPATSSSIPSFSSTGTSGTLDPRRERAKHHPVLFFLLPFLIAGGVAGIILLVSYLRKKIR